MVVPGAWTSDLTSKVSASNPGPGQCPGNHCNLQLEIASHSSRVWDGDEEEEEEEEDNIYNELDDSTGSWVNITGAVLQL